MKYEEFYSELGKLMYAAADIDKVITEEEKKALHELVRTELAPSEEHLDPFGSNAAFYSEMEFEFLDDQIADAEAAFESFTDFVEEHHTAFDSKMKKISLHVVNVLADAYHGTNKKEESLMHELSKRLNKIRIKKNAEDLKGAAAPKKY